MTGPVFRHDADVGETELTMDHFERALDEVDADTGDELEGTDLAPEAV